MSPVPSFETFSAEQRAIGCDEVLERKWKPNTTVETHTHPFSVRALLVQGEMWLTVAGGNGATYWVARTNRS